MENIKKIGIDDRLFAGPVSFQDLERLLGNFSYPWVFFKAPNLLNSNIISPSEIFFLALQKVSQPENVFGKWWARRKGAAAGQPREFLFRNSAD